MLQVRAYFVCNDESLMNFVGGGVDFDFNEDRIVITPPDTTECVVVNIVDDDIHERNELFSVSVSTDDSVIFRVSTAVVTIEDDDSEK